MESLIAYKFDFTLMNIEKISQVQEVASLHEDEQGDARNLSISLRGTVYKSYLTGVFFFH